jgi:hypothetical protein
LFESRGERGRKRGDVQLTLDQKGIPMAAKHSHRFVEEYDGFVGFGLSREVDENTLTYYLQKFSDDRLMALIRSRISDEDLEAVADLMFRLMKTYLKEQEYHEYFLLDEEKEE